MSALPANEFDHETASDQFNAYARCKSLEEHAHGIQKDGLPPLVCARILGYLLKFAPNEEGCVTFAREVINCCDDSALIALADEYSDNFIHTCEHPSLPHAFS